MGRITMAEPDATSGVGACAEGTEPRFESALQGLDQAIQHLESGELSLDEALACYERGVRLLRDCRVILEKAEQRVSQLIDVEGDGRPVTQPFDGSASFDPTAGVIEAAAPRSEPAAERQRGSRSRPLARKQSPGVFDAGEGDLPF